MERRTAQRQAIRDAIGQARRPLSAEEVLAVARRRCRGLGQATVYRALGSGVQEGWLKCVQMPTGPARYEIAELPHHHHFECTRCHRVFDVNGCPGRLDRMVPSGFTLQRHEILLFGLCAGCRNN
ncbi:MAG: transcriptional repressor [Phycisphaeraceae bacterium]|nr:transcriptional repressor [Phycisphaeraceae bacterium]